MGASILWTLISFKFNNNNNSNVFFCDFICWILFLFLAYSTRETLAPITSHICDRLIIAQCMRKKLSGKPLQKKTFRSVNLLDSLYKIVEFTYKICSHIPCRPRCRGKVKGSLILVAKRWKCYRGDKDWLQTKSDCLFFLPKSEGWCFPKYFPMFS